MKLENYELHLPSYSVGKEVYNQIGKICKPYGAKVLVIGGKKALSAAFDKISKNAADGGLEGMELLVLGIYPDGLGRGKIGEDHWRIPLDIEILSSREVALSDMIGTRWDPPFSLSRRRSLCSSTVPWQSICLMERSCSHGGRAAAASD